MSRLTILPGVGAVLRDGDERILLHHRKVGNGWAPISGHVEPGESVETALHREVAEETGLAIATTRLVTTVVTATVNEPDQLHGNEEATAWTWFQPYELPDTLLPYARQWLTDALRPTERPVLR